MPYTRIIPIEFAHCDPAGIVFYPRFLEFANSMAENFFLEVVGYGYARIIAEGGGVPAVKVEADFRRPSHLGDRLTVTLRVTQVGNASLDLLIEGRGEAEAAEDKARFAITKRIVFIDGTQMRSAPWPEAIRARLHTALKEDAA